MAILPKEKTAWMMNKYTKYLAISWILLESGIWDSLPVLKTLAVSIISPNNLGKASDAAAVIAKKRVPNPNNQRLPELMYRNSLKDCNNACFDILVLGNFRSVVGGPAMHAKFCDFYQCHRGNSNLLG